MDRAEERLTQQRARLHAYREGSLPRRLASHRQHLAPVPHRAVPPGPRAAARAAEWAELLNTDSTQTARRYGRGGNMGVVRAEEHPLARPSVLGGGDPASPRCAVAAPVHINPLACEMANHAWPAAFRGHSARREQSRVQRLGTVRGGGGGSRRRGRRRPRLARRRSLRQREVAAQIGDDYLYVLDGVDALPDPSSRSQQPARPRARVYVPRHRHGELRGSHQARCFDSTSWCSTSCTSERSPVQERSTRRFRTLPRCASSA